MKATLKGFGDNLDGLEVEIPDESKLMADKQTPQPVDTKLIERRDYG